MKLVKEISDEEVSEIEIIISDFDGVFTNNCVYTDEFGNESIRCNKYDSIGIGQLSEVNVELMVVSSERNSSVLKRCEKLELTCHAGVRDKGEQILEILRYRNLCSSQVLYIGNDINDLNALKFVGLKVAVKDSHPDFVAACDFITERKGGEGCIREICDIIRKGKKMKLNATNHKFGVSPNFLKPRDLGERPWGQEILLCHSHGKYMMKKLIIKKGSKGGLQYHRFKDEAGVLLSGQMIVRFEGQNKTLVEKVINPGDIFHFPAGVVHQEEAIEDCVIIECGTPILNDRVRMEQYFDMGDPEGMPTTNVDQVEFG